MATGFLLVDGPNPYTPQGTYPRRGTRGKLTGTVILHTSEGNWTSGVDALVNLIRTRRDYGSYHVAVDWADIAWMYPWEWEAWQDSETNNWAVGISAACRTTDWLAMTATIRNGYLRNMAKAAADFVVYMKAQYGIIVPLKRISGAAARAGAPGFCAHGDSGIARSDPGANFDWATFFKFTGEEVAKLNTASSTTGTIVGATEVDQVVSRLKAHINAVLLGPYTWSDGSHPDGVRGDVLKRVEGVKDDVWVDRTVSRLGEGNVAAIQELADAKTLGLKNEAAIQAMNLKLDEIIKRLPPATQ